MLARRSASNRRADQHAEAGKRNAHGAAYTDNRTYPRWHVHFTPTGASWLNQVECFFALLIEKQLRRGVHRSTQELEQVIRRYIDTVNADPRPDSPRSDLRRYLYALYFVRIAAPCGDGTRNPAEILDSLLRQQEWARASVFGPQAD